MLSHFMCISFLFRSTPIICFKSAYVNNFIEDYLGKKYHVFSLDLVLVSEHHSEPLGAVM